MTSETVDGNLTVSSDTEECLVSGKVNGNIFVLADATLRLDGEVNGNIEAKGGAVIFGAGALVRSDVIQEGSGIVDFFADDPGLSTVNGNVVMKDGQLLASGDSDSNRVNGSIECVGGVAGDGTGDELDWDGDGADDGTIDGDYKCP